MRGVNYWNNIAKWGLLIGIVMGSSRIVEYGLILSGEVSMYALLTVEWVVMAALFVALMYRVVLGRAMELSQESAYTFGHGLNYAMIVSVFASVVVAAMSYIYINSFAGGYITYIQSMLESLSKVLNETQINSEVAQMYRETIETMQTSELTEPSMFDIFLSTLSSYILVGTTVGVGVSLIVKRRIKKISQDGAE